MGTASCFGAEEMKQHKASTSCLLGSSLLVSVSCLVPASRSGLCVPSTRWMLADGNTNLLFNYLKRCMQIHLWQWMIEQGVCGPYPIFDNSLSYFYPPKAVEMMLDCRAYTCTLLFLWVSCAGIAHSLPCSGTTQQTVSSHKPKGQSATFPLWMVPLTSITQRWKSVFSVKAGNHF